MAPGFWQKPSLNDKKGKQNKNQQQLTKLVPFETFQTLRSELNEVALENILVYKYIDLNR